MGKFAFQKSYRFHNSDARGHEYKVVQYTEIEQHQHVHADKVEQVV